MSEIRPANIKTWLESAVAKYGEPIEAVVVGKHYNAPWEQEASEDENVLLDAETALAKLDHDFDDGFGGADCHPITAWTKSRVFFIAEYDGSTGLTWVFRNPVDHKPMFSGQ